MEWFKIAVTKDISQPFIEKVKAGSKTICLIGYQGNVFALSAKCPHAGGDLSAGWCKDDKLVCPLHRYSYNLQTGRGSEGQNDYVDTYPVEIRDDVIYIGVNSFWSKIKQAFK